MRNPVVLLLFALLLFGFDIQAQVCTPATLNYCCGFGITNVTFNTINNNSGNAANGYEDFTGMSTSVAAGQSYNISVTVDQPSEHNVRVWVDWNNDQVFDPVFEQVFAQNDVTVASGSIAIPGSALAGVPLRMRISADFNLEAVPTPCSDLQRGQAEDYSIMVVANADPPVANFFSDLTLTCDGTVSFTDDSENIPTAWFWDFGDQTTSNQHNPVHTYTTSGTYSVTLIATNVFGSDTLVQTNLITVNLAGMLTPASCEPNTTAYCCGYGIKQVIFSGINNVTGNGADGYQNYSCTNTATVTEGLAYNITVKTGLDNPEDVKVWIDYNNNGVFETTEKVFFSTNEYTHTGSILIAGGAVLNTALRMRVTSDFVGNALSGCTSPQWGQVEDYSIVIEPNTEPPVAAFTGLSTNFSTVSCDGIIDFTDHSTGFPASWSWSFGDGTTSTQQSPTHTYTSTGSKTVSLTVSNAFGSDTETKTNYINVQSLSGGAPTVNCSPQTADYCCEMGIYQVKFGSIDNITGNASQGYRDYSCNESTDLEAGQTYSIFVQTGPDFEETVSIWIDYNRDGVFNNNTERIFRSIANFTFHFDTYTIPNMNVVSHQPLRMRVSSDFSGIIGSPIGPCDSPQYGQVEDYTVVVTGEVGIETPTLDDAVAVYPNPTSGIFDLNVELAQTSRISVTLQTPLGQIIASERLEHADRFFKQFDLSSFSRGIYLLSVEDDNERIVKKIVLH